MKPDTQKRKYKIYGAIVFLSTILVALGLLFSNINFSVGFSSVKAGDGSQLVLDSSNAYTSGTDVVQHTKKGGVVTFTYSSASSSSGNHVRLANGGTLVNKDQITSVTNFTVTYSGTGKLSAQTAYVTTKWSDSFDFNSNQLVNTEGTKPYFIKFTASNGYVDIQSVTFNFTCEVNSDAESTNDTGSYTIVFKTHSGNDGTASLDDTGIKGEIDSGSEYVSSFSDITAIFYGKNGLKFASGSYAGDLTININTTNVNKKISSITFATIDYGDGSQFSVCINGSINSSFSAGAAANDATVDVNNTLTSIQLATNAVKKRAYLQSITMYYSITTEPGTPDAPTFEVGFGAEDANKNSYTTNSIYATDKALSVYSIDSKGVHTTLNQGGDGYSYVITNAYDTVIDPTQKFPAEGVYTVTVSYKSYVPVTITLNVGVYVYVIDVSASMTKTSFTTADVLSTHLSTHLKANLEYSDNTTGSDITYSEFASNHLGVYLINPKGITYDITKAFGTAGTWTVKVYDTTNEDMYYPISITVSAIPVSSVTMNESSASIAVEGQIQLTATVNSDATNQNIVWESSNASVASVDENGLVTGVAVGSVTITATASDNSGVYGSCDITVTAKPSSVSDTLTIETTGVTSGSTNYASWSGKTGTSGAVYAGQSAGGNNSIQLRSKNSNSGIITTSSGGKIAKVTVSWNSSNTSGKYLDIYGKDTAYSSPSDLFGSSSGTKIGSIQYGTSTELVASTAYKYVGVRSRDGAVYLDSITFVWGESTPAASVYPTGITLKDSSSNTSGLVSINGTSQLTIGYTPSDTTVKNVTYSSSNNSIATVSSTGLVTGIAAGNATITATAEAKNSTTVTATYAVTVTEIAVTSVSLSSNSETIKAGKTVTLVATVSPSNATNKTITWTSNATGVATVSDGVVTGIQAGTATITAKSNNNTTATCTVVVQESGGEETFSITNTDLDSSYPSSLTSYTSASGIKFQAYYCGNFSSKMQFKSAQGYIQSNESLELQTITINNRDSNTLTVYGSNTAGSSWTEITGTNDVYNLSGYTYFKIARTSTGYAACSSITIVTGTPTPTDPTNIILSPSSAELAPGGTKQISVSYVPSNANQNKDVTWTSSNTNVATVSASGLVSVKSTAAAGQSTTITARLTNLTSIYATFTVNVVEQSKDDHTVLIYMCGADLESDSGLATGDIQEILQVSGQPDDVNIVIETGGANSWSSKYGISSTKLERRHVSNKSLVKDDSLDYAGMGLTSTLQSFIEYGLSNYPADRTGLILWNHGGAMRGVCYDEKDGDDNLLTNEVSSAVSGALSNCGMSGQKLEWIGYDACLMQVQDIASINSDYFNYMIASEESESGYGWDYDTWVDDLYSHKTTPNILKAVVDGFITSNGGTSSSSNDQTLSYLDLSKMSAYITAWNNMSTQLGSKLTSSNKSSFNTLVSSCKHYADSDYTYYGIFDAKDFINKLSSNSTFNPGSSYTSAVLTAFADLVAYESHGAGAGNSNGLCMFWAVSSSCSKGTYYKASMTKFTAWRTLVTTYGN